MKKKLRSLEADFYFRLLLASMLKAGVDKLTITPEDDALRFTQYRHDRATLYITEPEPGNFQIEVMPIARLIKKKHAPQNEQQRSIN